MKAGDRVRYSGSTLLSRSRYDGMVGRVVSVDFGSVTIPEGVVEIKFDGVPGTLTTFISSVTVVDPPIIEQIEAILTAGVTRER